MPATRSWTKAVEPAERASAEIATVPDRARDIWVRPTCAIRAAIRKIHKATSRTESKIPFKAELAFEYPTKPCKKALINFIKIKPTIRVSNSWGKRSQDLASSSKIRSENDVTDIVTAYHNQVQD